MSYSWVYHLLILVPNWRVHFSTTLAMFGQLLQFAKYFIYLITPFILDVLAFKLCSKIDAIFLLSNVSWCSSNTSLSLLFNGYFSLLTSTLAFVIEYKTSNIIE